MSEISPDPQKLKFITVHGTGGGYGEDADDFVPQPLKWWEPDSSFFEELGKRVDLDPDRVEIVPFEWWEDLNGPNSEDKRRKSGLRLFNLLKEYEATGSRYFLAGHSHGGTVIYNALLRSTQHDLDLKGLQGWCTVGTPFMNYLPNNWIFQRLGNFALTAFMVGLLALVLAVAFTVNFSQAEGFFPLLLESYNRDYRYVLLAYAIIGGLSIGIVMCWERWHYTRFTRANKLEVYEKFRDKWIGLWHRDDEALSALRNIRQVSGPIIPSNFIEPFMAFVQIIAIAILGCILVVDILFQYSFLYDQWFSFLISTPILEAVISQDISAMSSILKVARNCLMAFAFYWLFTLVLRKLASVIGIPIAYILNIIIWRSVRERSWGDDIIPEYVEEISAHPPLFETWFDPLPPAVADPLSAHSNRHAIQTLEEVRRILGMQSRPPPADMKATLSEVLQWSELIHTAYFDVPEFVDTFALALTARGMTPMADGFDLSVENCKEVSAWLDQQPSNRDLPARRQQRQRAAQPRSGVTGRRRAQPVRPTKRPWRIWPRLASKK